MSSNYSSSSTAPTATSPIKISAGTAVKIGFFGALGATAFSLILSVLAGIVVFILVLLGVVTTSIFNLPR